MTPKEKAEEIYCKYIDALNIRDLRTTANPFAKQCALIAVDEILRVAFYADDSIYNHFLEVKQEIDKL